MKKLARAIGMLALLVGMTGKAWAAVSDALTVTITPNAGYAVDIATAGVTLDFPSASLDADGFVALPATVTIQSTLSTTDLRLDTTMGGGWSLGSSNANDTLQAWLLFTNTSVSSIPSKSGDNFDDTNDRILGATQQVGDTVRFEDGTFNTDSQSPSQLSHMWIRFHTPATTTDNTQKSMQLTLTAEVPN